jgi:hypothetical protein
MADHQIAAARRNELLTLLERLHRHKDAAYGDAWRKRGEVISIFANLARKYDRLLVALNETRPAATEPLADTVADLCVYAAKYLTWLAETHPGALAHARLDVTADQAAAEVGPEAVATVFAALAHVAPRQPDAEQAWSEVRTAFEWLERGMMAQATPASSSEDLLDWPAKATLAWTLADQGAWLLTALAGRDPEMLADLREEVARMDHAARS